MTDIEEIAILKDQLEVVTKENEELKKEISILLSCSNCSENKGRYICEKEYNDKCLSQKIEYIKELKEENEELKMQNKGLIHLLERIEDVVSVVKENKDKEVVLYWIKENAIRVFKQERQKGFSFDWLK